MQNTRPNISANAKFGGKLGKYKQTDSSDELIMLAADISLLSNISPANSTVRKMAFSDFKNLGTKEEKKIKNTGRIVGMFLMILSAMNRLKKSAETWNEPITRKQQIF